MGRRPQQSDRPSIFYVAGPSWWHRALTIGLAMVYLVPAALVLIAALRDESGAEWVFVTVLLVLCSLVIGVLAMAQRPRFVVSNAGILSRNMVRSRQVPCSDVARVEVDKGVLRRGQTVVVTHSGQRIGTHLTAASFATRRGESTYDHGPNLLYPALPTRAAIEARQRYLRGEFGRRGHQ